MSKIGGECLHVLGHFGVFMISTSIVCHDENQGKQENVRKTPHHTLVAMTDVASTLAVTCEIGKRNLTMIAAKSLDEATSLIGQFAKTNCEKTRHFRFRIARKIWLQVLRYIGVMLWNLMTFVSSTVSQIS